MMDVKSLNVEEQVEENVSQFMHKIASKISKFQLKEIKELFKKSHTIYKASECEVRVAPRKNSFGKILLVIPKKVGSAPKRNLIRRRIKSIFYQEKLYLLQYDFIILCRKDILNLSFDELKNLLNNLTKKLN